MARSDAVTQVGRLVAAYRHEVPDSTVEVYVEKLEDVDGALLASAVDHLIETHRFFPSIAEIRYRAADLAGLLPPIPQHMLAIVRRADRVEMRGTDRGGRGYVEKYWDWPPDLPAAHRQLAEETLAKVGESSNEDGKPLFGWDTGFMKTYEVAREAVVAHVVSDLSRAALPAPRTSQIGAGNGTR